jgi:hypothetical protein
LIVTDGVGWVQQWGDPVQVIRKGDVVWIPAGVKHWHGATPTTTMTHIAFQEQLDGRVVDWLELLVGFSCSSEIPAVDELYLHDIALLRSLRQSTATQSP